MVSLSGKNSGIVIVDIGIGFIVKEALVALWYREFCLMSMGERVKTDRRQPGIESKLGQGTTVKVKCHCSIDLFKLVPYI